MDRVEERRKYFFDNEKNKIAGKIPHRLEMLLARAYMRGDLEGPLEKIEDIELDRIYGVGRGNIAAIRKVIPSPGTK